MAARRGAKIGIVLVVLAIILVGVFVVVDRIAASAADDRITQETKSQLAANNVQYEGEPDVTITGFPFLTQVLAGEYKKITISLTKPQVNNVKLDTLTVEARSVKADARDLMNGKGDVVAGVVAGNATMSWENVRPLLEVAGLPSSIDPSNVDLKVVDNKIEMRVPLSFQGFSLTLIAKGAMVVETGKVRLKLESVTTDRGNLPSQVNSLIKQYQSKLQVSVKLPGLPYNLVVNSVQTTDAGLQVTASAADVKLTDQ
ncbi:LmeA family phospholipid-binding protein [Dactylosporangium sp. CS-033363]|uniref:LmeA family phospholipid-binding protein n=1 Tax=Dactylosporangium sp. CS-033363 TaxID=3239935 RepID=UPI003D8D05E5